MVYSDTMIDTSALFAGTKNLMLMKCSDTLLQLNVFDPINYKTVTQQALY